MKGTLVPLVMIPRFTSYVGPGTYVTVPLPVAGFSEVAIEFWRGELLGGSTPVTPATFEAFFEEAHEAESTEWIKFNSVAITADGVGLYKYSLTRRYFRMRIVLTADIDYYCAITCWASGSLVQRVAGD